MDFINQGVNLLMFQRIVETIEVNINSEMIALITKMRNTTTRNLSLLLLKHYCYGKVFNSISK